MEWLPAAGRRLCSPAQLFRPTQLRGLHHGWTACEVRRGVLPLDAEPGRLRASGVLLGESCGPVGLLGPHERPVSVCFRDADPPIGLGASGRAGHGPPHDRADADAATRIRDWGAWSMSGMRSSGRLPTVPQTRPEILVSVRGGSTGEAGGSVFDPESVNTHLRHVFDKLDIRSRVDLTRVVEHHS
jgi:hypothetical protein